MHKTRALEVIKSIILVDPSSVIISIYSVCLIFTPRSREEDFKEIRKFYILYPQIIPIELEGEARNYPFYVANRCYITNLVNIGSVVPQKMLTLDGRLKCESGNLKSHLFCSAYRCQPYKIQKILQNHCKKIRITQHVYYITFYNSCRSSHRTTIELDSFGFHTDGQF